MKHSRRTSFALRLLLGAVIFASSAGEAWAQLACLGDADAMVKSAHSRGMGVGAARPMSVASMIDLLLIRGPRTPRDSARANCVLAELMKRAGQARAEEFYRRAITQEPANPEFHWLFGDYLRNYRGAGQSLVPRAQREYLAALQSIPVPARSCPQTTLVCWIDRSLIALYDRDGLPVGRSLSSGDPVAFLSVQGSSGESLPGSSEDDVRALTSEAAFAASPERLNGALTNAERLALIRRSPDTEALGRLRIRYAQAPMVEVSAGGQNLDRAQNTSFKMPGVFNDVSVRSAGVALEAPLGFYPLFDATIRGDYRWVSRRGLIEFLQDASEDVRSADVNVALSRLFGPYKASIEMTLAGDDIDQLIARPVARQLRIAAPNVRLEWYPEAAYERRIAPRSSEFFAGSAFASETFGLATQRRTDVFAGLAMRAFRGLGPEQSFDVTIQATRYESWRTGVDTAGQPLARLHNAQVRWNGALVYRVFDRENRIDIRELPSLVFLHLLVTGGPDHAFIGAEDYVSTRGGVGAAAKLVSRELNGGTSFLVSAKYEVHRYTALGRDEALFHVSLGMGF